MEDREFLIFKYQTEPEALAKCIPEPLVPYEEDVAYLYFIKAKTNGLGEFNKMDMFVPCYLGKELVLFGV